MSSSRRISGAEAALLGLLCEGPMHAWQIEKTVKDRDMRFWTDLSQSAIYKQLRSLQRVERVECRQEVFEGRLRKTYKVTKAGREALAAKVRQLLSEPEHLKWRVDLGTYNLDLLPRAEAIKCLKEYRAKLKESMECYRALEEYLKGCSCPAHRRAVARRPQHLIEAEMGWVDEFVRDLRRK